MAESHQITTLQLATLRPDHMVFNPDSDSLLTQLSWTVRLPHGVTATVGLYTQNVDNMTNSKARTDEP